jgi:hypothetical protein
VHIGSWRFWGGLSPFRFGGPVLFLWAGPANTFFPIINLFKLAKYENNICRTPKISNLGMEIDNFKWNKFYFWPNFQISIDFEL